MPRGVSSAPVDAQQIRAQVERFLASARRPALIEPGEPLLLLEPEHYTLEDHPAYLALQAWDGTRNLVRKIRAIERTERGKLLLMVQRFGGREGELHLIDLAHPRTQEWERRGARLVFRERFRRMLAREFPDWRIALLSSEPDLEHTLSPAYPRALLTRGNSAMAAISAPPECADFPSLLSFGLIWLDYVRQTNPKRTVEALTFWAPSPVAPLLSFYLPLFASAHVRFAMYLYSEEDFAMLLDPRNYGNVATQLDTCRRPQELPFAIEHAEAVPLTSGAISLRVNGLEFARYLDGKLGNGREPMGLTEARAVAANLYAMRNPLAPHGTLVYQQNPEAWLESVVRARLATVDASLLAHPVYGQVPAIAGQDRTILDLLAVDHRGRLAVLELKASQDLHLPLQALDYWLRVKWHLDRGEFPRYGYFPGIELRRDPPRLLLIAPSLDFHPSTETVLRYLVPAVEVVRIGLSADWRENVRVMFRLSGAERPHE
jgi:hypothetical protein